MVIIPRFSGKDCNSLRRLANVSESAKLTKFPGKTGRKAGFQDCFPSCMSGVRVPSPALYEQPVSAAVFLFRLRDLRRHHCPKGPPSVSLDFRRICQLRSRSAPSCRELVQSPGQLAGNSDKTRINGAARSAICWLLILSAIGSLGDLARPLAATK